MPPSRWSAAMPSCGSPQKAPLTALATSALFDRVATEFEAPANLHQVIIGDRDAGTALAEDERVALVSATGSTEMGRDVGTRVARGDSAARCWNSVGTTR